MVAYRHHEFPHKYFVFEMKNYSSLCPIKSMTFWIFGGINIDLISTQPVVADYKILMVLGWNPKLMTEPKCHHSHVWNISIKGLIAKVTWT